MARGAPAAPSQAAGDEEARLAALIEASDEDALFRDFAPLCETGRGAEFVRGLTMALAGTALPSALRGSLFLRATAAMHAGALAGRDAKLAQETLLADADALSAEALVATIDAVLAPILDDAGGRDERPERELNGVLQGLELFPKLIALAAAHRALPAPRGGGAAGGVAAPPAARA